MFYFVSDVLDCLKIARVRGHVVLGSALSGVISVFRIFDCMWGRDSHRSGDLGRQKVLLDV